MNDEYIGITAVCGDEGTGKTSMALSYPKPLFHMDIDVGGFYRARARLEETGARILEVPASADLSKTDLSGYDVVSKAYPRPLDISKMMGQQVTRGQDGINIRFTKKVSGMRELWQTMIVDIVRICQLTKPVFRTIVIDTSTKFYNVAHNCYLQELQEKQIAENPNMDENRLRERLSQYEYGPVYDRIDQVFHTLRSFRRDLVLTHYPKDIYAERLNEKGELVSYNTGQQDLDGYKHTGKLSDMVIWLYVAKDPNNNNEPAPFGKVSKAANLKLSAVGQIIYASHAGLMSLCQKYRKTATLSLEEQLKAMQKPS